MIELAGYISKQTHNLMSTTGIPNDLYGVNVAVATKQEFFLNFTQICDDLILRPFLLIFSVRRKKIVVV